MTSWTKIILWKRTDIAEGGRGRFNYIDRVHLKRLSGSQRLAAMEYISIFKKDVFRELCIIFYYSRQSKEYDAIGSEAEKKMKTSYCLLARHIERNKK